MLKALVVKELRESAGIVALAILVGAYVLGDLTGVPVVPWQNVSSWSFPFVQDSLYYYLYLFTGGLAIALGMRQTAWELGHGTYYFLLHRPTSRGRIFGLKLLIGSSITLVLSALLILIYAWWAATPGHRGVPFEWSMTRSPWICWIALQQLYVGAFLSGIRPARWYGTRLVPLAAAIGIAVVASYMPWFWAALCITLASTAVGLVGIFYYVRERDF